MKSSTIGPVVAACLAGVTAAGCLAGPGARPVKLTAVHTPSAPASKIDLYYAGAVRAIEARDYAQALDYLQTARAIGQEDVRVINAFGVVYDKLGRFDLSRRYYAQAKALDPASKVVDNNLAYSERLQGLSREPLAFASAAEAEVKLRPQGDLMPGSPVVVVPIAAGGAPVVAVATIPGADPAPELFGVARRPQVAAAGAPVKPAAAEVGRVVVPQGEAVAAKPALAVASAPRPVPAKAQPRLAGAPIQLVDASGSPDAARRLSLRLARLGWSVQAAVAHGRPVEASSRIDYPARSPQIAQALARTLPGAVKVRACPGACPAIRLVVGRDARAWSLPRKAMSRS